MMTTVTPPCEPPLATPLQSEVGLETLSLAVVQNLGQVMTDLTGDFCAK